MWLKKIKDKTHGVPVGKFTSPKTGAYDAGAAGATAPPPAKHTVDAKGKPKGAGHLKKHKANFWGPEGHGDRSISGLGAKVVNTGKDLVKTVKTEGEKIKEKIN